MRLDAREQFGIQLVIWKALIHVRERGTGTRARSTTMSLPKCEGVGDEGQLVNTDRVRRLDRGRSQRAVRFSAKALAAPERTIEPSRATSPCDAHSGSLL